MRALLDYPADYLKRWDQLCQKARHTGVSANDAHHNQGFRGRLTDDGKIQLEDGLGEKLAKLDPEKVLPLKALVGDKKPGELVFELDLDPYARSFRHVSTHLLMHEITRRRGVGGAAGQPSLRGLRLDRRSDGLRLSRRSRRPELAHRQRGALGGRSAPAGRGAASRPRSS